MKDSTGQNAYDASLNRSANPEYAVYQLAAALGTSQEHSDPGTRERAVQKVKNWIKVFQGMMSGALDVGSRTPLARTPVWITLEVVHGGFATGDCLAEGALQPHEEALLTRLQIETPLAPRATLNRYYLSDAGIAELQEMAQTGRYRIHIPEEGALLVVAWLLANHQSEAARDLLDEIAPYLNRLRFYPLPHPQPQTLGANVRLQTVAETVQNLQAIQVPRRIQAQKEATQIWAPLCDRIVELFLETLEGAVPTLETDADGKPIRNETGAFVVQGGWVCQRYPEGWRNRAESWLEDYRRLRQERRLCGKPERKGENLSLLRGYLEMCVQDPQRLTGRDVGRIRSILARIVTKRGVPSSERCQNLRQWQAKVANLPTFADFAEVVLARLSAFPQDEGLDALEEALAPIAEEEAATHRLGKGALIPKTLERKVQRCLAAPVEVLVERNIIPSGEVLARVIPQITAQVSAACLPDPALQQLYGAIYQAFRRRRSLLLLNLEHQVRLEELPWINAIEAQRHHNAGAQEAARKALERIVTLTLASFPHQILPNKLLQELRTLAKNANITLPLVDEVAADIFMGAFSEKFLRAAQQAGALLEGSLYERYYGISYARVREINDVQPAQYGKTRISPAFFRLCSEGEKPNQLSSWIVRNGRIIEREQILTTHNLATLYGALNLTDSWRPYLFEWAQRCFTWVCRKLQQSAPRGQAHLQAFKNAAYAWRQMIFFLALLPDEEVRAFLAWASDVLAQRAPEFQERFRPIQEGLNRAIHGLPTEESNVSARCFLGWTIGTTAFEVEGWNAPQSH